MKLFYFDIRGQAECTRLMFNLTDIKFEDVRFDAEAWEEKYKALAPSGAVRSRMYIHRAYRESL